eukprot:161105-Hanusia_phi.AAC.1
MTSSLRRHPSSRWRRKGGRECRRGGETGRERVQERRRDGGEEEGEEERRGGGGGRGGETVSYTHLRAHETVLDL